MPNNTPLNVISWNQEKGFIACGGDQGLLKVLKLESGKGQGGGNLSMNQNLAGHQGQIQVIQWNDSYQKLTTSDEQGLIIVWMMHKQHWFEEMINNRNKSVVTDMRWTPNGEKIGIVYEDGAVIVGSVEGNRLWGKELKINLALIEWSPDSRQILFGTPDGAVNVYDYVGNYLFPVKIFCLRGMEGRDMPLAAIEWYDNNRQGFLYEDMDEDAAQLCIAYRCGRMQLMRKETDDKPILVDTGMNIKCVKWNPNGNVIAVAGSLTENSDGKGIVQFYSAYGSHLRSLRVPGTSGIVNSLSWEGYGLRMSLVVDCNILFSNIQPEYMWAYFNNTLVFAFRKPERNDMCVIFWDTAINEKHVKYMRRLQKVAAAGEYCILVAKLEDADDTWVIILCNAVGCPIDNKYITIEPKFVAMNKTHVIIASEEVVYFWQYRSQHSKLTTLEQEKKKKSGKENVFHIEEIPNPNQIYDREKWRKPDINCQDQICSVAAGPDSFIVGRMSGAVFKYTLPHISLEHKLTLRCRPQQLCMNCDSTKFSIIDINGILSFYDLEAQGPNAGRGAIGEHLQAERKEVWSVIWSTDNPKLCALMEKNRLYVLRDFQPEEPVLSSGYLCDFTDLEVKAVLLDEILKDPEEIKNIGEMIVEYEAKSLRDTRDFLTTVSLKDAVDFVEKNPHKRLWKLIAEAALDKLNFPIAERAFVKNEDYYGVQFVNKLQQFDDKSRQKAEIAAYFKRYDEAEQIYKDIDRKDMALDLRMRLGDWPRVVQLMEQGAGNDQALKKAYKNLGDYTAERQRWTKATKYYSLAQDNENLIDAYYRLEDTSNMEKIITILPENSPLLDKLGEKFQSLGMSELAVQSYVRGGDVKKAIDCCVLLNQWNQAVELAEQHNFLQIEQLLQKYANHLIEKGKKIEAIELFRKANKNTESARLLAEIAQELRQKNAPPLLIKKIYVLAAFEVDSYKQRVFDAQVAQITGTGQTAADVAAKTMNSLITSDISSSADKALTNPWKGAEAIHYYLLCQRQLYQKDYNRAMKTAMRLVEYEKELQTKDVYSLIALSCYFNECFKECSKAFVKLERLPDVTDKEREQYELLAINIFSRHPPHDKPKKEFNCPKRDCKARITEFDINCKECGSHFSPCIASGQSILAKEYHTCKTCKHKSLESELNYLKLKHCPLCHGKIQYGQDQPGQKKGMTKANPLSALGRMGYGIHLLFYPGAVLTYIFAIKPYMAKRNEASEQAQWDSMPKPRKVDPDLFNPFSPIPYHNNPELKYAFAHVNLFNYTNKNHLNSKEYVWKDYHNSFDHNNNNDYLYNWVSMHSKKD